MSVLSEHEIMNHISRTHGVTMCKL